MTAGAPAVPSAEAVPRSLWQGRFRLPTVALMLGITLVAFEAMAVATVMPVVVDDLGGLRLYPWAFTAFFLTDVVGIAVAGERCDRQGPVPSLVGGLLVFAAGLVVGAAAPDMAVFVAGRALQGLGAGAVIVAIYVLVADVYPAALRPRVFAALSAAWVVPALVGPALAGVVAEHLHWRVVFGGLVPPVALGALLLLRASSGVVHRREAGGGGPRRRTVVALGAAAGLGLVQAAGDPLRLLSVPLALLGVALLAPTLRRLLPAGTLRVRTGLPAAVAMRGLLAATFFGAEAFLPYALVRLHGYAPAAAGLPLTVGAVGWSAGSWVQGHWSAGRPRWVLAAAGLSCVATGVAGLAVLAADPVPGWVAVPVWTVAGFGMGLSMPVLSVLVLELSPPGEQGASSAALQICDVLGSVVGVGLGGALLAAVQRAGGGASAGIAAIDVALGAVALAAVPLTRRLRRPAGSPVPLLSHADVSVRG